MNAESERKNRQKKNAQNWHKENRQYWASYLKDYRRRKKNGLKTKSQEDKETQAVLREIRRLGAIDPRIFTARRM